MNKFIIEYNRFKLPQITDRGERRKRDGIKNNFNFVSLHIGEHFRWKFFCFSASQGKFNLIQNHKPKFKTKTIEKFFLLLGEKSAVGWTCGKFPNNFNFFCGSSQQWLRLLLLSLLFLPSRKLLLINFWKREKNVQTENVSLKSCKEVRST